MLYGWVALAEYAPRPLVRALLRRRYRRTSIANLTEYDNARRAFIPRLPDVSLEQYLAEGEALDLVDHFLLDGKVRYGRVLPAAERVQAELLDAVLTFRPRSVLEVGCGSGRNLLAIRRVSDVECYGIELSPASVELACTASERYGLPITVSQGDLTVDDLREADVVFSCHTLENIPNFAPVLDKMLASANKAVVLVEPIIELLGWSPLEIAARIRAYHLDRLRGLWPYVGERATGRLLSHSTKAINRSALVVIRS